MLVLYLNKSYQKLIFFVKIPMSASFEQAGESSYDNRGYYKLLNLYAESTDKNSLPSPDYDKEQLHKGKY